MPAEIECGPNLMTDAPDQTFDYSQTLFLPKTDFPMRAGLPQKEPEIIARWARADLYRALRESGKGRPSSCSMTVRPTPTAMFTSAPL